jgi:hypothetical protein
MISGKISYRGNKNYLQDTINYVYIIIIDMTDFFFFLGAFSRAI